MKISNACKPHIFKSNQNLLWKTFTAEKSTMEHKQVSCFIDKGQKAKKHGRCNADGY